jgi:hypothetical protein
MPAAKGTRRPNAGKGRPKGAVNKVTKNLRGMYLGRSTMLAGRLISLSKRKPIPPPSRRSLARCCHPNRASKFVENFRPSVPARLADAPGPAPIASPLHGQHSDDVLARFGFLPSEIAAVRDSGAVR